MIERITIENFRGIERGTVEELAPLSILVGRNNTGKSTVLEALAYYVSGGDSELVARMARRRGWCGLGYVPQMLFDPSQPALFRSGEEPVGFGFRSGRESAVLDGLGSQSSDDSSVQVDCTRGGHVVSKALLLSNGHSVRLTQKLEQITWVLIDVDALTRPEQLEDAYSDAVASGHEDDIHGLLERLPGPERGLRILKREEKYILHVLTDGKAVPLYFCGDGFKRLLHVACLLASSAGGHVFIEEPECFQHPANLEQTARLVWAALEQGTQVVLSTHSRDLLSELLLGETARPEEAAVFKTSLVGGELTTIRIDGPRARERLDTLDEDLRR